MIEVTSTSTNAVYKVFGTVRGNYQQPLSSALIRIFDKDIRSEQFLNETKTNEHGHYEMIYSQQQFAFTDKKAADIIVRVYDENETLLGESQVYYNAGREIRVDINLSGKDYKGISEFERMTLRITPYTGRLPLPSLTETNETKDITFLTNKTNLPQNRIEMFGMSFRFAQMTHIEPTVFYGLMRENVPGNILNNLVSTLVEDSYESKLELTFDGIMHESIDVLMNALSKAIEDNIVPFTLSADFERIKKELMEQLQVYSRSHPATNLPTGLFQRIRLAGLSQEQEASFSEFYKKFSGPENDFWKSLQQTAGLSDKAGDLQTAFELFNLTDQSVLLSSYLIQTQGVKNPNDLSSFTKYSATDWEEMIKKTQAVKQNGTPADEKIKSFGLKLEK